MRKALFMLSYMIIGAGAALIVAFTIGYFLS
jgi:hypothetical protein